jgi:hypothetical protein
VHVETAIAGGPRPAPIITSERVAAGFIELSLLDAEDIGTGRDEQGRKREHAVLRLEPIL